jgi:hypothetical protein
MQSAVWRCVQTGSSTRCREAGGVNGLAQTAALETEICGQRLWARPAEKGPLNPAIRQQRPALPHRSRKYRTIFDPGKSRLFAPTSWWRTQSKPNRSPAVEFPAIREKNREFLEFGSGFDALRTGRAGIVSGLRAKSLRIGTGNSVQRTGNFIRRTGNSGGLNSEGHNRPPGAPRRLLLAKSP